MNIISYNVKSGGQKDFEVNETPPERFYKIVEVVKKHNPDVVSFVDTYSWDSLYSLEELQEAFNYKKAFTIGLDDKRLQKLGHDNGITVLSNIENVEFKSIRLNNRNAVITKIIDKGISIYSVYLDDVSEEVRLSQISALEENFNNESPMIICGDFNSYSAKDDYHIQQYKDELAENYPEVFATFKHKIKEMSKYEVVHKLENLGFIDASTEFIPTTPTKMISNVKKSGLVRVDYFFYKNIQLDSYSVLNEPEYDLVSDHYPIFAEFSLTL